MNKDYRTQEIFGGGKFWRTIQVIAIGEEKFGEYATVSAYAIYVFCVSVNIGEENFGKWLTIRQIRQFFPYQNFPVYITIGQCIFKPGTHQPAPGFLELLLSMNVCMRVCLCACVSVCVCLPPGYKQLVA